ncbi:MAG: hypothetical protein M1326_06000 [Cyanobacteria bacterium]|nr:hypothetical protein [Cyanobacteriota bacterium]
MFLLIIITSCSIGQNNLEIWEFTKSYLKSQIKIEGNDSLVFPENNQIDVKQMGKNKYEVKSYIIFYHWTPCCPELKKSNFTCLIEFANGKYNILSFKIEN